MPSHWSPETKYHTTTVLSATHFRKSRNKPSSPPRSNPNDTQINACFRWPSNCPSQHNAHEWPHLKLMIQCPQAGGKRAITYRRICRLPKASPLFIPEFQHSNAPQILELPRPPLLSSQFQKIVSVKSSVRPQK